MHSELRHILLGKHCCKLTCAVVAEVEEDDSVAFLDPGERLALSVSNDYRLDELIGNTLII